MIRAYTIELSAVVALALAAAPARASFHLMQIEQVIGGVHGDPTAQAIQLRMRAEFQNQVQFSRIRVVDAAGQNPIEIIRFNRSVPNWDTGVRVLIATANFSSHTSPPAVPDFIMTNPIPPSYLAAGSLIFEDNGGAEVLWRLSWGGAAYTGSNTGGFTNDADGNFGPPIAVALPSDGASAARFTGPATAKSTRNIDDYEITPGAAVFTANSGQTFTVNQGGCDPCDMDCNGEINAFDIEPFIDVLFKGATPCSACAGDTNGDNERNAFDIEPFLVCLFP